MKQTDWMQRIALFRFEYTKMRKILQESDWIRTNYSIVVGGNETE